MGTEPTDDGRLAPALRAWFLGPPRRHGEVLTDRVVSFLELFYDLVFVVLVGQVAHTLAGNLGWAGVADFAVVFGLVWIAWLNGSLYHEMHGREDGRGRTYIFVQMLLLVVLAVYAGEATGSQSTGFAVTYTLLLAVLALQWWTIRRYDVEESFRRSTVHYVLAIALVGVLMLASAALPDGPRLVVWAGIVVGWVLSAVVEFNRAEMPEWDVPVTESMAERFGLLTIIVLGEVVVGVTDGLIEVGPTPVAVATGLLALCVGFGFWWNYFDAVGRRTPQARRGQFTLWLVIHLPLTGAIAAAGAGMVSLVEHAADDHVPAGTAWLLAGSSALLLGLLGALVRTLDYRDALGGLVGTVSRSAWAGALACMAVGLAAAVVPGVRGWVLALSLTVVNGLVWAYVFARQVRQSGLPAPGRPAAGAEA